MKTKNDVKTILSNQIYLRDSKDSKTRFFRFHHTNFLFFLSFNKLHYVLEGGGGGSHNKILNKLHYKTFQKCVLIYHK